MHLKQSLTNCLRCDGEGHLDSECPNKLIVKVSATRSDFEKGRSAQSHAFKELQKTVQLAESKDYKTRKAGKAFVGKRRSLCRKHDGCDFKLLMTTCITDAIHKTITDPRYEEQFMQAAIPLAQVNEGGADDNIQQELQDVNIQLQAVSMQLQEACAYIDTVEREKVQMMEAL